MRVGDRRRCGNGGALRLGFLSHHWQGTRRRFRSGVLHTSVVRLGGYWRTSSGGLRCVLHINAHVCHARHLLQRLSNLAHHRRIVIGREKETKSDFAVGGGRDVAHHFRLEDVDADAVIPDARERVRDAFLEIRAHAVESTFTTTNLSSVMRRLSWTSMPCMNVTTDALQSWQPPVT